MSLLRRLFEGEHRAADLSGFGIPSNGSLAESASGVAVSSLRAMQQAAVWACTGLISDTIAGLPVGAFRKQGDTRAPVSPDPGILVQPHAELDFGEWVGQMLVSLLLRGDGYGHIEGVDRLGYPTDVCPLSPDDVRPGRNKITGRIEFAVGKEIIPDTRMLHLRGLMLPGTRVGLSAIEFHRQAIGLALAAEEFGARWFADGATPGSVLEVDDDISKRDARRLQAEWVAAHGRRHRRPAVLGKGVTWKAVTVNPGESQFLETRQYQTSEIARIFRVPPHLIGDVERSTSWGSGIEEQNLAWITYGLGAWITRLERALTRMTPKPQYVRFNIAGLLRGRLTERFTAYQTARNGGWLSVDEIRALEEMAPVPDGKGSDYLQPLNMGLLGADPNKQKGAA